MYKRLNKMFVYKYVGSKGYSCSWPKYLIHMWHFIINLKTTVTVEAIAALTDTYPFESPDTHPANPALQIHHGNSIRVRVRISFHRATTNSLGIIRRRYFIKCRTRSASNSAYTINLTCHTGFKSITILRG